MAIFQIRDKGVREDLFLFSAPGLSDVSTHEITGSLPVIERGSLAVLKYGRSLQHLPEPVTDLMASGADVCRLEEGNHAVGKLFGRRELSITAHDRAVSFRVVSRELFFQVD